MNRRSSGRSSKENIKTIENALKRAPILDVKGYPYVMFPLNFDIDPDVLEAAADEIIRICDFRDVDKIVTMEAKGIAISTAVSMITSTPVVIARQRKLGLKDEMEISKKTAYGESRLYLSGVNKGDRIVVLDDVMSTGGSLVALIKALRRIGAKTEEVAVIYNRKEHGGERKVKEETGIDVKSIIIIEEVTHNRVDWKPYTGSRG